AAGWWRAERASRRAVAAAAEASRQHQAALAHEQRALENEAKLDALVGDLINDDDPDPNVAGQQQDAAEKSLRRAAASLEALPGPARSREISVAWRRLAMLLAHRGEFTAAESALEKAQHAAAEWLRSQPAPSSQRNALMVKLCQLRLSRQRGTEEAAYRLAHEAMTDFRSLPPDMQAELNGTVWLENARLSIARELIDRNHPQPLPAL